HTITLPFCPPAATSRPPPSSATPQTPPFARDNDVSIWPVSGFHNRTTPSKPPLASSRPSSLMATLQTGVACRCGVLARRRPRVHTLMTPCAVLVTSNRPSVASPTPYTGPACGSKVLKTSPLVASQSLAVPSSP